MISERDAAGGYGIVVDPVGGRAMVDVGYYVSRIGGGDPIAGDFLLHESV